MEHAGSRTDRPAGRPAGHTAGGTTEARRRPRRTHPIRSAVGPLRGRLPALAVRLGVASTAILSSGVAGAAAPGPSSAPVLDAPGVAALAVALAALTVLEMRRHGLF